MPDPVIDEPRLAAVYACPGGVLTGQVNGQYDAAWAEETVERLARVGVEFAPGLTPADLAAIEAVFGAPVPPELERFLGAGVPVSPKWARWSDGPEAVADVARAWIDNAFAFDITQCHYWHPRLGERPSSDARAVEQALRIVSAAPPLIPVYSHRFIATSPADGPRAVLSVWRPTDTIIYGTDLADYLANEFRIERPTWAAPGAVRVPVWEDLFDL